MNALLLTEAMKPLTKSSPLGDVAAQAFAKLLVEKTGEGA